MSRINTNISSIQAVHRLIANQNDLAVRLERLSSGLRINRGRDDPAGLIASESLRSEIVGISQAIENSTRAINVIATAEGALNEVSALLLEIRGLIVKSANEGALSQEEIEANQLQIDSILDSIDRIANTTQFNGVKLLNGSLDYTLSSVNTADLSTVRVYSAYVPEGATMPVVVEVLASAQYAQLAYTGGALSDNVTIQVTGNKGSQIFSFQSGTTISSIATTINSYRDLTGVSATLSGSALLFNSTGYGSNAFVTVETIEGTFSVTGGDTATTDHGRDASVLINGQQATVDGLVASVRSAGLDIEVHMTSSFGASVGSTTFGITGGGAIFQLAADVTPVGQFSMGIPSVATGRLGNSEVGYLSQIRRGGSKSIVGGNYQAAQEIVDIAIKQIATLRGRLGGFQRNQLETNINSQQVALENVKASESAIRDADYAQEVAALTRAQILVQSTTSILSLANQLPQNVLALLR